MPKGERWPKDLLEKVIQKGEEGWKPEAITRLTGIPVTTVRTLLSKARKEGRPIRDARVAEEGCPRNFHIPTEVAIKLDMHARDRGMIASVMIRKLLSTIAAEPNLIEAILDGD